MRLQLERVVVILCLPAQKYESASKQSRDFQFYDEVVYPKPSKSRFRKVGMSLA